MEENEKKEILEESSAEEVEEVINIESGDPNTFYVANSGNLFRNSLQ